MNPLQALNLLATATEPQNIGRLTRADFVNVQHALDVLRQVVERPEARSVPPLAVAERSEVGSQSEDAA